jgi:hypothetical protein
MHNTIIQINKQYNKTRVFLITNCKTNRTYKQQTTAKFISREILHMQLCMSCWICPICTEKLAWKQDINKNSKYYIMLRISNLIFFSFFFINIFFCFYTGFRSIKSGILIWLVRRNMRTGRALFPRRIESVFPEYVLGMSSLPMEPGAEA